MTNAESTIEHVLCNAITHHQAGRFQEAGELYQSILKLDPNHSEANHNLGVLAVQVNQPAAGLVYLMAALNADPSRRLYWISYIDALLKSGQLEEAQQVLALARQNGLEGDEVEALEARLHICSDEAILPQENSQQTSEPIKAESKINRSKKSHVKSAKKPSRITLPHKEKGPNQREIDTLMALYSAGRHAEVADLAQKIVTQFPSFGLGWKILGITYKQMGRNIDALVPMQNAAAFLLNDPQAHNNLGVTLKDLGRLVEAEASFRRAIKLKADYVQAYSNLASTLHDLGRLDEAESNLRKALQIKPDYEEALNNLGSTLHGLGRLDEAESSYRNLLKINPDFAEIHFNLGAVLYELKKNEDALYHLKQHDALAPGNTVVQHLIASLTNANTERAPVQYVKDVFNRFAENFDTQLQQDLHYEIPEKLAELIGELVSFPEVGNVLDLGCGTGLMGLAISPIHGQMVGVDLSEKMLEKARARNIYQRLECSDLLTMMRNEPSSSYDLIAATDVFVYLGKLDEIIREAKRLLIKGGLFAFSIEAIEGLQNAKGVQVEEREYQLQGSGRYAHSVKYLSRLASDNDFQVMEMKGTQIRMDHGKSIDGYIGLWRR